MIATAETTATLKRCTGCGEFKPAEPGYFRRAGAKGLSCWCVPCMRAYQREKAATAAYQEARRNYRARPEVREADRAYKRERRAKAAAVRAAAKAAVKPKPAAPKAEPCAMCGTTGGTVHAGCRKPTRRLLPGVGRVCLACQYADTKRRRIEAAPEPRPPDSAGPDEGAILQIRRERFGLVGPRPWRRTLDDLTGPEWSRALVRAWERRTVDDLRAIYGKAAFQPEAGKGARCTA